MTENLPKEYDEETIKAIASNAVEVVRDSRAMIINDHSASYRWLVGSLLAINGGAAIAMLGAENVSQTHKLVAGAAFYLGIISALGTGVIGQIANRASILPFNKMLDYWVEVKSTAEIDVEAKAIIDEEIADSTRPGVWARLTGYVSAIMFTVGIVAIGIGIGDVSQSYDHPTYSKPTAIEQIESDVPEASE